jgi:hypothetical protein
MRKTRTSKKKKSRGVNQKKKSRLPRKPPKPQPAPKKGFGSEIAALFRGIGLRPGEEIQELRGFTIRIPNFEE